MSQNDRIERLERKLAEQQADLDHLRARLGSSVGDGRSGGEAAPAARSSRRTMLRGGAVAAGAALVGAIARPEPATAADGGDMIIGANNVSAAGNTRLRTPAPGDDLVNRNIFTVSDDATSSGFPSAIGAVAQGDRVHNGLYTFCSTRIDSESGSGHALVVRGTSGSRSGIYLVPGGGAPPNDAYAHRRGSVRVDASGNFWFCVSSGTPGTWRKLSGSTTAGATHPLDPPRRVYDSRFVDGPLAAGFERVVSVADAIDVETGAVTLPDAVPDGATAILFNLAITETVGGGFLQLAPGTATEVTAATINWSAAGVTVANGSFSSIDASRRVKILSGGTAGASTHFIVDVTAYTL